MDLRNLCLNQKKNTIDPENIISNYGADAARLFILSDSPPEKDVQWSEEGIVSSFKFIQKLWNLNSIILEEIKKNHQKDSDDEISKFTNKLIKKVTENLENFSYNKIVANLHEMYSFFFKQTDNNYSKDTLFENYHKILVLMSPVIPHFANECLQILGKNKSIFWPSYDDSLIEEKEVQIVIQINGKKRGLIKVERNIEEELLYKQIINDEKISKFIIKGEIKKKIYVKNRLVNLII